MPADKELTLLHDYVTDRDDRAFERLVALHIDLVFGCALRRTADASLAEEISQTVFTILARKAHRLHAGSGLAGWLHKTTLYESTKALRGESRRRRKMKALAEHTLSRNDQDAPAGEILPMVDEAIDELPEDDRRIILLHYFEGRSFREISASVGKSEAASQKQASRALGKLGKILQRRGVVATASALAAVLATESAKAAPAGIISSVSGGAIAGASSLSTSTLITNAIQTMTYAKTRVALAVALAAAVPIGVQMKSNGDLKKEVEVYREREAEFVERGERLATLEATFAALPAEFSKGLAGGGGSEDRKKMLSTLSQRQPALTATAKKSLAGSTKKVGKSGSGELEEAAAELDEESGAVNPFGNLAEMLKDPAMRSLIEKQMEAQIKVTYDEFLDYLQLDDKTRSEVFAALQKRQMAMAQAGMEKLKGKDGKLDLSKGEEIADMQSQHNEKLKELMGDESFAEFERFEQSASERSELASFRSLLETEGSELPFETEQELMAIMYEERTSTAIDQLIAGDSETIMQPGSARAQEMALNHLRSLQGRVRNRVSDVLTVEQLKVFEQNQSSHLKLLENGMEMSKKMFGEGE